MGRLLRGDGQQAGRSSQPDHPLSRPHSVQRRATREDQAAAAAEAKLQPAAEELTANGADQVRSRMKVRDVPPGRLLSVEPQTSLAQVAKKMRGDDADSVAVMSEGRLLGIITGETWCARSLTASTRNRPRRTSSCPPTPRL